MFVLLLILIAALCAFGFLHPLRWGDRRYGGRIRACRQREDRRDHERHR
ncbi:hypothetical protein ACIP2Y_19395 [Streptomyces sviceus]